MQIVEGSNVQSRFSNGFPRAVDMLCPHCIKEAPFDIRAWHEHGRQIAAADVNCPRCAHAVLFILLLEGQGPVREGVLYSHPPSGARSALAGLEQLHEVAAPLGRSYESALKLYNRAEWGPAALMLRHLLEGMASRLLPDGHRDLPLTRQIEVLPDTVDLAQPLREVASLLANAGPFGRAFEDEALFDRNSAEQLLELTELLIGYLLVMPAAMAELRSRIETAPVPLRRPGSERQAGAAPG